ncbi:MAG: class I SAM-dependent methyltransferase [archaeon]
MEKDIFEKKYMEHSWSKEAHQAYKTDEVDDSVKHFLNFLISKNLKGSLLDIGCGNGKNTIFFQNNGFNSTGIDFSKSAINICKTVSLEEKSKAKFLVASILNFELDKQFEVLLDCGCLHHIRRSYWNNYKKNILKLLKIGGYFYIHGISDCEENKMLPKHPNKRNWIINKKGHYTTFFSYDDIVKLLGDKFKIEKHYQFKSKKSPLMVRVFYIKRLK